MCAVLTKAPRRSAPIGWNRAKGVGARRGETAIADRSPGLGTSAGRSLTTRVRRARTSEAWQKRVSARRVGCSSDSSGTRSEASGFWRRFLASARNRGPASARPRFSPWGRPSVDAVFQGEGFLSDRRRNQGLPAHSGPAATPVSTTAFPRTLGENSSPPQVLDSRRPQKRSGPSLGRERNELGGSRRKPGALRASRARFSCGSRAAFSFPGPARITFHAGKSVKL